MVDAEDYRKRLRIKAGRAQVRLFTKSETPLLLGYERIVFGGRGPYIEFDWEHLVPGIEIVIPSDQAYRQASPHVFYTEYRTSDAAAVKIYFQKKTVDYADYRPGLFYISPFELMFQDNGKFESVIEKKTNLDQLDLFANL